MVPLHAQQTSASALTAQVTQAKAAMCMVPQAATLVTVVSSSTMGRVAVQRGPSLLTMVPLHAQQISVSALMAQVQWAISATCMGPRDVALVTVGLK